MGHIHKDASQQKQRVRITLAPLILPPLRGRWRAQRAGWGQCSKNGVDDTIHVLVNLVVPKAQNPKSFAGKVLIANTVRRFACRETVLRAIDLYDELLAEFGEVDDIASIGA